MKKVCSEEERALLNDNKEMLIKGIFENESKGSFGHIFISLFVSLLCIIAGIIPNIIWLDNSTFVFSAWALSDS